MKNNAITSLKDPVYAQDAATKNYFNLLLTKRINHLSIKDPVSNFPIQDYSILISPAKLDIRNNMITLTDDGPLFKNVWKLYRVV